MKATTLGALAEPGRMRIVELLREGALPVGEIATRLEMRQPQASKHLKVLSEAGLVQATPMANQRHYSLRSQPFEEMESWLEKFRKIWDERLDNLEEHLNENS
jgi:DNA-binding transcriptional ArsR family regulator